MWLSGTTTIPSAATARRPQISRSVSGDGASWNALMIQRSLGMATSKARMAALISQFRMTRILSTTKATGKAAE